MDDEELLAMVKALDAVTDLSADDRKTVDRIAGLLKQEKRVVKKDQVRIQELHKEHLGGNGDGEDPNEDIDEDDFV